MNITLEQFEENMLEGQKASKGLEVLLTNECALAILKRYNFTLLDKESLKEELSDDYLSDEARTDSDIMANVKATDEVFQNITFFATCLGRFNDVVIGYWHGNDKSRDISKAPFVVYTSEGEFELLYDYNIIESILAAITLEDEDEYEEFKVLFKGCDIELKEIWDLDIDEPKIDPEKLHLELYDKYKKEQ